MGTLHCFDVTPELRLKNHAFVNLNEPILCICNRPAEYVFPSIHQPSASLPASTATLTTEILIGLPYGYIIVMVGEADSKGQFKKSFNKLSTRRIVRFTNSPVDCAVNCIAHVVSDKEGECYWCGCGGTIFILRSSDWNKLEQVQARVSPSMASSSVEEKLEVSQLVSTEVGVWGSMSGFSGVSLWDKTDFTLKLHLNYW